MNIKKRTTKIISLLLSFAVAFGNVIPAYAMENNSMTVIDGENISTEERNLEDVTVTYKQASSFFVTIPKTIVLDGWKESTYSVKVSGDIDAEQCVYVAPVDAISKTENIDFYMKDQATENAKDDVLATVTHNKFHWNSAEVSEGYKQEDNIVSAPKLTAGAWRGTFQMEIKLETHVTHKHNYVATITKEPTCTEAGEKTYTCDCGESYTQVIPATGHSYVDGECEHCHEKDPNYHKHSYTEKITKEPTCTEAGEKTFTCTCGDSYTEEIPATGHSYVDGECEHCHEKDPDYHKHSYDEGVATKEPTCTEKGVKTFTCICGHSYTEEIPAKGHNYEDGKCTECGEIDPNHTHSYDEGVITKEPTCTERGEKTLTCSECGHSYIEDVGALGHDYIRRTIWENASNGDYAFVQDGTKWTSNNNGIQSSTATSTWTITLNGDAEYSFKYKVSSEEKYDKLTITLDDETIANAISGVGEEITYTSTLTAGTHTLTATYTKDHSNDRNDDCGYLILEDLSKGLVEIKEPTCTESGENIYKCSRCGMTFSEIIPATGHNYENCKCTICGEIDPNHTHTYEPYELLIEPQLVSSTKGTQPTNTAKYKIWQNRGTKDGYSDFYVNSICTGGSTGSQFNATAEIVLPDDYEGEYNYKYYYTYTMGCRDTGAAVRLYVNGSLVHRYSVGQVVSAIGSVNTISTIPLHAGKNTVTLKAHFYNASGSANPDADLYNWYDVYLENITLFDGTEYHICNECGKKEAHVFGETITKEATCTEAGEKVYTCSICDGQFIEEIPATGHNYVDGICDKCGDLNLKLTSTTLFSASASTSAGTEEGHGHYDTTNLNGTYSDEIEITEDMGENDYLQLYFTVSRPSLVSAADPVSGSSMLQKYDEETNTWKTIYSYSMSYNNLTDFSMRYQEGGGGNGNTEWISRKFQLEKGKYRVYGQFSAKVSCASRVQHYFWYYRIRASLCRMELDTET